MNPKKTALVMIEFQNDFCTNGGVMYPAVQQELERQNTLANAHQLATFAKSRGILTILLPLVFDEQRYLRHEMKGVAKTIAESGSFRKDSWGSQVVDTLATLGDVAAGTKSGLCGFDGTNLDEVLHRNGIKNTVICGLLTNLCVESTARTAYDKGYHVTIAKDATAAMTTSAQSYCETSLFPLLGDVLSVQSIIEQLS